MSQKYLVLYEYESRYDSELDLVKDEIITLLSTEEGGWSEGKNEKGKLGWYPTAFVAPYNGGAVSQVSNASLKFQSLLVPVLKKQHLKLDLLLPHHFQV